MKDLTRRTLTASRILLILLFFNMPVCAYSGRVNWMAVLRDRVQLEKQTFLRTLSAEAMSDIDGRAQIDFLQGEIAGEARNKARELSVAEILLFP